MRTFIAIDFEPGLKTVLQDLIRKLKRTGADVRWTRTEGLHLTLKFLGQVVPEELDKVKEVMGSIAGRHRSFPLKHSGTGAFPNERNPRVLWVGFAAEPALLELQEDLERGLESAGFPREDRPFKPHLTLGRVNGPSRTREAVQALSGERPEDWSGMTVRKITLFESRLHPDGAEYRVVAETELL